MTNLTMSQFHWVALHSRSDLQASAPIFQRIASRYRGKVRGSRRIYFKLRKDLWSGILPSQHRRDDLWKSRRCHMYLWTSKAMFDGQESEQKLISVDIEASNAYEDGGSLISGPLPGDLAEVEAFCRIFRFAEQLHNVVFDALRSVSDSRKAESSENEGDIPLLEEKVVSGLACIGALLHNKKQQVLGGRAGGSEFAEKSDTEAGSTRLADFRSKMLKCGEQLEMALCCYFPPVDDWGIAILRRFQKFRNVCYDSGIPRPEGSPSHADIPNWVEVTLWPVRGGRIVENNEAMFWRGGSITEDGLRWLLDKKFKAIVDLRVEEEIDQLAKAALENAVLEGRLKLVNMPVQPGKLPTKQQVEEFARLVADLENRPLYLLSHEGVGRTSAMIMRWRELALCWASSSFTMDDIVNGKDSDEIDSVAVEVDAEMIGVAGRESDYISVDDQDAFESISHLKLAVKEESEMVFSTDSMNSEGASGVDDSEDEERPLGDGVYPNSPFDAQRPAVNVLSRRAMSKFKKGRTVTPSGFLYQAKSFKKATSFRDARIGNESIQGESIAGPAGWWALASPGIPRALTGEVAETPAENQEGNNSNGALVRVKTEEVRSDNNEEPAVVGDMCVSTTGVVRLQSRKKAEIYLVRTDGASCARERVKESTLAFTHPSTQQQMLMWKTPPKTVFLLKKLGSELMEEAQQVASFLYYHEGMNVLVEPDVHDRFARFPGFGFVQTFHNQDTSDLHERVDFVICLGGDGVILHASNIFRNAIPPVVAFNLGSLGFLTTHPFEDFKQDLQDLIHGNNNVGVYITLRMRLRCELFRNGKPIPGKVFDVLNEVVVDRGSNPYLCKIECYERNRLITKVQADGVIVATPTGSTAYSTSAGGSMVHPNVPCMLFTPICPHSLSFRPVILPDSALLELKVPRDARSNAWVSFDGKRRQQLSKGDSVRVSMSEHPLPTVNKSDQTDDWFRSLVRCLNWNERLEQKTLSSYS